MNTHNMAASQGSGYSGPQLLTGEEAQKILGEILESERRSRSLTFPAHTGAQGYFRDGAKYVAFDNSTVTIPNKTYFEAARISLPLQSQIVLLCLV